MITIKDVRLSVIEQYWLSSIAPIAGSGTCRDVHDRPESVLRSTLAPNPLTYTAPDAPTLTHSAPGDMRVPPIGTGSSRLTDHAAPASFVASSRTSVRLMLSCPPPANVSIVPTTIQATRPSRANTLFTVASSRRDPATVVPLPGTS